MGGAVQRKVRVYKCVKCRSMNGQEKIEYAWCIGRCALLDCIHVCMYECMHVYPSIFYYLTIIYLSSFIYLSTNEFFSIHFYLYLLSDYQVIYPLVCTKLHFGHGRLLNSGVRTW